MPMTIGDFTAVFLAGALVGGLIATIWYWTAAREQRRQQELAERRLRQAAETATATARATARNNDDCFWSDDYAKPRTRE